MLEAESWRRRQEHVQGIVAAYQFAAFNSLAKVGKLESLEKYLPEDEESGPVELTPEQSKNLLLMLAAQESAEPKAE